LGFIAANDFWLSGLGRWDLLLQMIFGYPT
jgi:hypothetical protein